MGLAEGMTYTLTHTHINRLTHSLTLRCDVCNPTEYMITMFDTKTQELRWNATYNDYSAPPYDEKQDYSMSPTHTHCLPLENIDRQIKKLFN